MNYAIIKVKTQTSTFRDPDFQNFHKSLNLPPPTTIMGFVGAALGFSPKKSQDFFIENNFEIGISGKNKGKTIDLWKYNNFKQGGSIMQREILFYNEFHLIIGHNSLQLIEDIISAVKSPKYALTLGSSDSLAFVKNIIQTNEITKAFIIKNCLVFGDIVTEVLSNTNNHLEFSIYSTSEPITHNLPIKFHYESDYGIRKIIERKKFSFIGKEMKLNVPKKGVKFEDLFIPVFQLY